MHIHITRITRKHSISFRSNLARLTEKLIEEGKIEKAKAVIDLTMEKMPFGYFGYYVFLDPFVNGYYEVGETEKARDLFEKVAKKYQEYLEYYGTMDDMDQLSYTNDIINNMERYRALLDIVVKHDTEEYGLKQAQTFNDYLPMFSIYREAQRARDLETIQQEAQPIEASPVDSAGNPAAQESGTDTIEEN